jgi:CheY-like chemotaxis protein
MALRVLLADESTTIKKVMQLALQDFAVEVKAVHAGVDVIEVAKNFKPDIVFADVLLQKKNGYEVCGDLKADPQLSSIPVVLMWSSFMDLDEKLAKASGADRRLEKPFDIENLREIVLELVPRTRDQKLAHFLRFPETFAEPLKSEEGKKQQAKAAAPPPPAVKATTPPPAKASAPPPPPKAPDGKEDTKHSWNMESFEDINDFSEAVEAKAADKGDEEESFAELRLSKSKLAQVPPIGPDEAAVAEDDAGDVSDEAWSHKDLSRFKIELPPVAVESEEESSLAFELPSDDPDEPSIVIRKPPAPKTPALSDFSLDESVSNETTLEIEPVEPSGPSLEIEETFTSVKSRVKRKSGAMDRPVEGPMPGASRKQLEETGMLNDFSDELRSSTAPQVGIDRLEEIVRTQSREIIQELVQRLVPDLASEIIREELERLLEDTSARDRKLSGKMPAGPEGLR